MNEARPTAATREHTNLLMDLAILGGFVALFFGIVMVAREWRHPVTQAVQIDLSLSAIPKYALFSFARGWIAYFFSFLFTVVIGSWAFYDARARRLIIPALDILQSIPVLGFLPGLSLALVALFPHSTAGLELVCILAIFTGQVWNMVFSYYDSLRGTPGDFRMLGKLYNLNWWQRFWRLELPFSAQGLLYNSMVSMAAGWFFLSVCEAPPPVNGVSLRVPGLGSYIQAATESGDNRAKIFGMVAMGIVILIVDRLIWWPMVLWSRKFKLDDFGGSRAPRSQLQLWLARSVAFQTLASAWQRISEKVLGPPMPPTAETSLLDQGQPLPRKNPLGRIVYYLFVCALIGLLAWGAYSLVLLLKGVHLSDWREILVDTGLSLMRVLAAVMIGTIWTVPVGIWIGLNPKLSNRLQPFIQFAASFPSPMLYPWLVAVILFFHGTLQTGAVLLILFGTQWYILFNVAGSAAGIPNDIISCSEILRLRGWTRWRRFLIPAIMPGLVTGWITAAGGAWNATIVSEIVPVGTTTYAATGLGAYITTASNNSNFAHLTAAVIVMAVVVVGINRVLWKRLQNLANDRCRFIT
ncbi:MAG TPA: ABC transporter permease subunit [Opitutaceae bacterium]